jgi:hypothetical protein
MSAFYNVAPENKLRVIAPGCRRRLRLQDLHLSEEMVVLWASKKTGGR